MLLDQVGGTGEAMSAVTWPQLLMQASSPRDVLAVAREFTASIDARALARLPAKCQPAKLVDPDDVMEYAYELVRHHLVDRDPRVAETLDRLVVFFSQATARLSQLNAPLPPAREIAKLFG